MIFTEHTQLQGCTCTFAVLARTAAHNRLTVRAYWPVKHDVQPQTCLCDVDSWTHNKVIYSASAHDMVVTPVLWRHSLSAEYRLIHVHWEQFQSLDISKKVSKTRVTKTFERQSHSTFSLHENPYDFRTIPQLLSELNDIWQNLDLTDLLLSSIDPVTCKTKAKKVRSWSLVVHDLWTTTTHDRACDSQT